MEEPYAVFYLLAARISIAEGFGAWKEYVALLAELEHMDHAQLLPGPISVFAAHNGDSSAIHRCPVALRVWMAVCSIDVWQRPDPYGSP